MAKLKGKRVLITGGAHGMGKRMGAMFLNAGCKLVLTDIDENALEKARQDLAGEGGQVHVYAVDVSDQDQVEEMAEDVLTRLGGLDILINNAGIGHSGELVETPIRTWKKLMDVNFWGPIYHVHAFLPAMVKAGSGQIVNVSSGQAFFRLPTWGAYAIIKLAAGAYSELLRIETRKLGIRVTTVYPYMVHTGFYKDVEGDTLGAKLSMKLLPLYSLSVDRASKIIFKAIKKKKSLEMMTPINNFAAALRAVTPLSNLVSKTVLFSMGKSPETLMEEMEHLN